MDYRVECMRAEDFCAALPDNSVDLIVTDPPYHRCKAIAWDREHKTAAAFIDWLRGLVKQWARILKPNGSLYVFASPQMAARVEVMVGEVLQVLSSIVWRKPTWGEPHTPGRTSKESLRSFFPWSERVIFAEHYGADNIAKGEAGYGAKCDELRGFVFEPLRAYLVSERDRAGFATTSAVDARWQERRGSKGCMAGHWFGVSQWELPTADNYAWLRSLFGAGFLPREYEDLRAEYESLRQEYESLRRPFTVSAEVPYTDVWDFKTVQRYPGKHECEKPWQMAEHIVLASSRPGAVVADFFCGSGVFLAAAVNNGRRAIGCDMAPRWVEHTTGRIQAGYAAWREFGRLHAAPKSAPKTPGQLALFDIAS